MLQPPVTIPVAFVEGMLSGIRARVFQRPVDVDGRGGAAGADAGEHALSLIHI